MSFFLLTVNFFSLSSSTSRSFPLSSSLSSSSPSLYLLPLLHGHIRQHLRPPPQHLRVASPSLGITTSGHGSISHHLRWRQQWSTWSGLQKWSRLRPWSHLSSPLRLHVISPTMVASRVSDHGLVSVLVRLPSPWLRLVSPFFFPLLFCLNLDLNHFFFSNFMIVGIYCGYSTSIYVPCSSLDNFIFPLVEAKKIKFLLFTYLLCLRKLFF